MSGHGIPCPDINNPLFYPIPPSTPGCPSRQPRRTRRSGESRNDGDGSEDAPLVKIWDDS